MKLARPDGFTLVETMIALIILAFALLALAGLMVTTTRNNSAGGQMTVAATLAQDKLEELRTASWCDLASFSGADTREGPNRAPGYYNRNWIVDPNPPTACDTLRTINVTVDWTDKMRHSVTFRSVLSHEQCPGCP